MYRTAESISTYFPGTTSLNFHILKQETDLRNHSKKEQPPTSTLLQILTTPKIQILNTIAGNCANKARKSVL